MYGSFFRFLILSNSLHGTLVLTTKCLLGIIGDMFTEEQNEMVESAAAMLYGRPLHINYQGNASYVGEIQKLSLEDAREFAALDNLVFQLVSQIFLALVLIKSTAQNVKIYITPDPSIKTMLMELILAQHFPTYF